MGLVTPLITTHEPSSSVEGAGYLKVRLRIFDVMLGYALNRFGA